MTRAWLQRWLLLAAASCLALALLTALVNAPASPQPGFAPDSSTVSRLSRQTAHKGADLRASTTVTDTNAAVIAAEPLLNPVVLNLFLPLTVH